MTDDVVNVRYEHPEQEYDSWMIIKWTSKAAAMLIKNNDKSPDCYSKLYQVSCVL